MIKATNYKMKPLHLILRFYGLKKGMAITKKPPVPFKFQDGYYIMTLNVNTSTTLSYKRSVTKFV